uniref:Phytocyanin domain-containing protein n=1 Tax=Ananas comosus var. bracteatus TaxID=296719 RepID=A0A6V7NIL3_ANACO|nr:unnamed protein product [Ananas comosus var. bracteatus]
MEKSKGSATTVVVVVLVLVLGLVRASAGAVYAVGDSAGWTIIGNINYTAWATTKKFRVEDVILFVYNNNFHNVMEVSKADYKACNAASPSPPTSRATTPSSSSVPATTSSSAASRSLRHRPEGRHPRPQGRLLRCSFATPTTSPSAGGGAIGAGGGSSTGTTPVSSPRPNSAAAVAPPALLGLALLAVVRLCRRRICCCFVIVVSMLCSANSIFVSPLRFRVVRGFCTSSFFAL